MKESKLLILGVIALLLAGGLALASCTDPTCDGGCGKNWAANECKDTCSEKINCSGDSDCHR